MDILTEVLRSVRLSGAVLFRGEFSSPWCLAAPDSRSAAPFLVPGAKSLIFFHVVTQGQCSVAVDKNEPFTLSTGDVIALPYGDPHAMGNPLAKRHTPLANLLAPPPWRECPVVVHGGGGERTQIICGFLHCDDALLSPVITKLPRILWVRARAEPSNPWLEMNCRYMLEEACANRPGGACVLGRLAELLFVEVLRRTMEELGQDEVGWLAALKDPTVGKALELIHGDLAHPWTVEALGRAVGLSRSALAERFRQLLGEPMMRYLTRWRLQRAAQLLRDTHRGLAEVAAEVGYDSEFAFNRAFKRFAGEPPASWRRDAKVRDNLTTGT
jgi:AraC-like DNA-binding protein